MVAVSPAVAGHMSSTMMWSPPEASSTVSRRGWDVVDRDHLRGAAPWSPCAVRSVGERSGRLGRVMSSSPVLLMVR